jgi:hypothetical protein
MTCPFPRAGFESGYMPLMALVSMPLAWFGEMFGEMGEREL